MKQNKSKSILDKIKDKMKEKQLTQTELAKLADMEQCEISSILNGRRDPGLKVLVKMLNAAKIEINLK